MSTLRKTCWSESNARPASSLWIRSGRVSVDVFKAFMVGGLTWSVLHLPHTQMLVYKMKLEIVGFHTTCQAMATRPPLGHPE